MCSSTTDAHGSASSGGKIPLLRIVKKTRMERFSWLVMGVIVLATGLIFLTDQTQRTRPWNWCCCGSWTCRESR